MTAVTAMRTMTTMREKPMTTREGGRRSRGALHVRLRPGPAAPREARRRLARLADRLGEDIDRVELIVSELVTNSVRYSPTSTAIDLDVRVSGREVEIRVRDEGPGFDGKRIQATEHGHGLGIVEALATDWGVDTEGGDFRVWARLAL